MTGRPAKKAAGTARAAPAKSSRRTDPGAKPPGAGTAKRTNATKAAPSRRSSARTKPPPKAAPLGAGARIRAELSDVGDPYGVTVLITQAARVADRLEVLDRLLSGDAATWLRLEAPRIVEVTAKVVEVRVDVRVDNPVLEERQQATVLRHLMSEIHRQRAGVPMGPDDDDDLDGI